LTTSHFRFFNAPATSDIYTLSLHDALPIFFTKGGELGFCGIYCPEADGGMGLGRLDTAIILEELAAACTSTAAFFSIHNMVAWRSEEHTSELQSRENLVCRLLLEKKKRTV